MILQMSKEEILKVVTEGLNRLYLYDGLDVVSIGFDECATDPYVIKLEEKKKAELIRSK